LRQIILRMKNLKYIVYCLLLAVTFISCNQQEKEPEKNFLLLISFDGFKYDYFERANTPNFDKLIAGGVKADGLIPVFPTKTFPNHYSIVTGLYPENSGIVSNTMYDKEMDKSYRIGDREAVENPAWYQGEPIWNTAERQGLTAGTCFG
jgi:ectonucleotide pyrophosphatase/phosphodiesterase family member 5